MVIINPPPQSGEGYIGMHFVSPSICPSVAFRVRSITYVCIDGLPSNLVQMLSSLRQCAVTQFDNWVSVHSDVVVPKYQMKASVGA